MFAKIKSRFPNEKMISRAKSVDAPAEHIATSGVPTKAWSIFFIKMPNIVEGITANDVVNRYFIKDSLSGLAL